MLNEFEKKEKPLDKNFSNVMVLSGKAEAFDDLDE